jgi:hypothetical protein
MDFDPIYILVLILVLFVVFVLGKILKSFLRGPPQHVLEDFEVLEIQVPKFDVESSSVGEVSSLAAENMFASLHGLLKEDLGDQEHFSFEIVSTGAGGIKFYVVAPYSILRFVESQIYAQYPTAVLKIVSDYAKEDIDISDLEHVETVSMGLSKEQFFPIKTHVDLEVDPLSGITSALAQVRSGEQVWLQFLVRPVPDKWQSAGYSYVEAVREGTSRKSGFSDGLSAIFKDILGEVSNILTGIVTDFFSGASTAQYGSKYPVKPEGPPRLTMTQELEIKAVENKLSKMGFLVQIRGVAFAKSQERVENNLRSTMASFKQFYTSNTNSFTYKIESDTSLVLQGFKDRVLDEGKAFVLTVEELGTVFHLPSSGVETPNISWVYSKKSEPPSTLPTTNCNYIGETIFRNNKMRFGIDNGDDRLRHMYLIGKSGTGKSTLLEVMITQDIKSGSGVGVLDPHGETIERVLECIPDERVDDVILIDPSDASKPVGVNLMEIKDQSQKNLMASALVSAIKQHFDYSWGPRLEYLLNYCLLTLLEVPGTTMLAITRLLEDDNYLKYILHFVKDPVVQKFWNTEYKAMKGNQKLVTEAIAPIQNKVNRFLASTTIRNILGQKNSTVDFWDIMNSGKILLINLSKGKVGADNANLLGALLVSRLQFMALQRAKIPYEERTPFYLYVDEFQNFATGSFEEILSESRKYKLGLYLTHQYTAQLPEEILEAVFGNVGTIATFALGAPDAKALASEFAPFFDETDIISLERFHVYIKLMIDGMTSLPFSARILLPWDPVTSVVPKTQNKEKVVELSRQRYGTDREYVEGKVGKWIETRFDRGMAIAQANRAK